MRVTSSSHESRVMSRGSPAPHPVTSRSRGFACWTLGVVIATTVAATFGGAAAASGQDAGSLAGIVTDVETGQPLAGVLVSVSGSQLTALTNAEGQYVINDVPVGEPTVRVQTIGYASGEQTVTVTAGAAATLDFTLQPQAVELEGLVAVGYGEQRREDITGAVASVTAAEFIEGPALDAASLVAGKIAGLSVTTPSGDPRDSTEISLRGIGSIQASRSPLVIVDGVPGDLETVAPQDIASIDVLKDGSAAAVYGSRAANGVVFITTKTHQGGAPTIRYNGYVSQQTIYRRPDMLDADDYARLIGEGLIGIEDYGFATDWQDQVLRNPVSQTHNLTIVGGGSNTSYTGSFTYEDAQGIMQRSDQKEVSARLNLNHTMYDGRLAAEVNVVNRFESGFDGPDYDYAWHMALKRNPTDRVQDDDGRWQERGFRRYDNPLGLIHEENGEEEERNLRVHGRLTYRPIDALSFSVLGGTERSQSLSGSATTFEHINTRGTGLNGTAERESSSDESQILDVTTTFSEILGAHQITLLGGYSYQDILREDFEASTYDFPTDLFGYDDLGSGGALALGQAELGSSKESFKTIGFFGRINWDWNNRFLAMASLRYEGDSRFGADHKWGIFPAVSAGWRISEESFIGEASFIDDLKLRAGFGVTGIAPNDAYLSLTTYEYGERGLYGGDWVQGLQPSGNPNPDLRWERKEEINLGLDFSLFDFRLAGSLDVYRRDTKDMLYNYSVPVPPYLTGNILANVGHMRNEGIEAALTYDVVRSANFSWQASGNWSTNKNRLVNLSDDVYQPNNDCFFAGHTEAPIQQPTHRICVGGTIGNFYTHETVDIDEAGGWIVLDAEGNRIPHAEAGEEDKRIYGNGIPDHYVALNNRFEYGPLDLTVNMRGAFGHQILNAQRMELENTRVEYNYLESALDPVYGKRPLDYDLAYVSYYIEDGTYWKFDNATLGYTVRPQQLQSVLGGTVSAARVYVSGRNLWTITGYKGIDPEVRTTGLFPGFDERHRYPTTRTFTVGVNLTF